MCAARGIRPAGADYETSHGARESNESCGGRTSHTRYSSPAPVRRDSRSRHLRVATEIAGPKTHRHPYWERLHLFALANPTVRLDSPPFHEQTSALGAF